MANTQQIKRRIKSVKNTKQITKAMELVAASKMRKAQEATLKSRAYRNTAREILTRLGELTDVKAYPLFERRIIHNRLFIVVTSDRGLAGAYNSNVLRFFAEQLKVDNSAEVGTKIIAVGRQGSRFAAKIDGSDLIASYEKFPDQPSANDLKPIIDTVSKLFLNKEVDAVDVIYTDFKSSIAQEVANQRILPAAFDEVEDRKDLDDSDFEPSPQAVLETITPKLVEVQLFQAFLEASASEHSMRMLDMKNATDNASDLIDDLTLEFNSARQAAITQELAEITGGAEAIS